MQDIQRLIEKLWANEASEAEKETLLVRLTDEEDLWKKTLKEEYERTWQNGETLLAPEQSQRMLARLHERMGVASPAGIVRERSFAKGLYWAAAAAILAVAALAVFKYVHREDTLPGIARVARTVKQQSNATDTVQILRLADGSIVTLEPHSAIGYYEPFDSNDRVVSLSGGAMFTVHADKDRPFTVAFDGLSTVALGTRFSATDFATDDSIVVRLYEGKVAVRLPGEVILKPGNELVYDKQRRTMRIRAIVPGRPRAPVVAGPNRGNQGLGAKWVRFDNQPLPDVFEQLGRLYGVRIGYAPGTLRHMAFIGKIDKTDSLEQVLHIICSLNHLSIERQGNTYIIKK